MFLVKRIVGLRVLYIYSIHIWSCGTGKVYTHSRLVVDEIVHGNIPSKHFRLTAPWFLNECTHDALPLCGGLFATRIGAKYIADAHRYLFFYTPTPAIPNVASEIASNIGLIASRL